MEEHCKNCGHGNHWHRAWNCALCSEQDKSCPGYEPKMDYRSSYIDQLRTMSGDSAIPMPAQDHIRAALRIIEQEQRDGE